MSGRKDFYRDSFNPHLTVFDGTDKAICQQSIQMLKNTVITLISNKSKELEKLNQQKGKNNNFE